MNHKVKIHLIASHVSLAGLLYGLDTGFVGPITTMPQFTEQFGVMSAGVRGIFISIFLVAAAVASIANGVVSDFISRKWTISLGAAVSLGGCVISFFGKSLAQMFIGRVVYGIGTGLAFSCCITYICEIAPVNMRGQLGCMVQMFVSFGAMCGYFITYATVNIDSNYSWRIPFVIQFCVGVALILGNLWMPYSPRWLLSKGRNEEAESTLNFLRGDPIGKESEEGILLLRDEVGEMKQGVAAEAQNSASYSEIFSKDLRGRAWLTLFLMVIQQAVGIDAILYFAPTIFKSAGLVSNSSSFLASSIIGATLVVFSIPGFFVDRTGRRRPTLIGGSVMAISMLTMGVCFAARGQQDEDGISVRGSAAKWTIIVMIYLFVAAFSASWAVILRTYSAEIMPTRQRSRACALQQYVNWLANFAVAISAPSFLKASTSGPYFFYGTCCVIGVIVCAVYMRETAGQSLERMHMLFNNTDSSTVMEVGESSGIELHQVQNLTRAKPKQGVTLGKSPIVTLTNI